MGFREVNHLNRTKKTMFTTEFWVTLAILASAAGLVVWMGWLEKQPKTKLSPRLFPTTLVMVLALVIALFAGFHMIDLAKPVVGH
jgi:asparagine N-glycosylation enzyme membrane subunit Stt3